MGRKQTWERGAVVALLGVTLLGAGAAGAHWYRAHTATEALLGGLAAFHDTQPGEPEQLDSTRVRRLLAIGASTTTAAPGGFTVLNWAAWKGDTDLVEALLARGVDPNGRDGQGATPLMAAASASPSSSQAVRILLQYDARVDDSGPSGYTPLLCAAGSASLETVRLLLAHGADARARDSSGVTALMAAAQNPDPNVIRLFLRLGINPGARDHEGRTALYCAARWGKPIAVRLLLERGVAVDPRDNRGATPLFWAVHRRIGTLPSVQLLLSHGADPNVPRFGRHRTTLLQHVVEHPYGLSARLTLLLRHNADLTGRDSSGRTILERMAYYRQTTYWDQNDPWYPQWQREYTEAERLLRAASALAKNGRPNARLSRHR